ncbi:hypothetical protein FBQ80_14975 [Candidatus Brocadia sp. AMX2]|uniref:hypothetical protein n=1 Tax=Candidatus Brocadia TaxID=380240 RepID=UPI00138DEF73|nr:MULTISPECIES: hypothetical protein [Brocadia]MDL1936846.1 hypothetical protein [Candidatus Brocadia sp. AMX2]NOG42323.1 hypothetical protein [Planctomycetota bacterium]NUO06350.1 hypothetical protein [Candidatus Brocadia sinica]
MNTEVQIVSYLVGEKSPQQAISSRTRNFKVIQVGAVSCWRLVALASRCELPIAVRRRLLPFSPKKSPKIRNSKSRL